LKREGAAQRTQTGAASDQSELLAVSTENRTIDPDLQRFMAKRMNVTMIELRSSHTLLISHPHEIARCARSTCRRGPRHHCRTNQSASRSTAASRPNNRHSEHPVRSPFPAVRSCRCIALRSPADPAASPRLNKARSNRTALCQRRRPIDDAAEHRRRH
jgi:hypothetical protein